MERMQWLILAYQVPVNPSKIRVYVWRKLKEIGATYLKPGVALLPKSPGNLVRFQILDKKIQEMNGDATIAEMTFIDKQDESKAIAEFRLQSRKEYQKIIAEMKQLATTASDTPEKAPEISEKTKALSKALAQIKARDYFLQRLEPEQDTTFQELLQDMSTTTSHLREYLSAFLAEQ